ncbi:tRNA lysidine(34) synthetase TilS [Aestuariivivens insulae]|uniref:tRNA lysidine(34) synthetase TilS n=1 Tax=Aestuariivivens insulae TaxID=1621988 RepID=UPI001F5A33AE|nr:tRNA lysidine(34) synthetase TilS [Aestuariivivens insulae]
MLETFKNHINSRLPFLNDGKLLIAISGGVDSVVLTHLCYKMGLNIALAHCNFNLRGDESDLDESFVLDLAEDLDVEVFVESFDTETYAKAQKLSIQMAARELRYNWFTELAEQLHFNYILTAHHADDNLETFLINFTRGTGLEGLTGIPEVNDKFVRPLLPFSEDDIVDFAKSHNIKWRDDSSNKSVKYLRNKLRHEVVPILKTINPSLLQSFQTTLDNLNASSNIIKDSIETFLNNTMERLGGNVMAFKVSEFKKLDNPKAYLYEVFKSYGFTEWEDVTHLLDAETGKYVLSKTHRLIKNRTHLLLSEINKGEREAVLVLEQLSAVETPLGTLRFTEVDTISETNANCIYVDKALLQFPLKLRKKKEGEYFYPLGMTGRKKLSKYFKDEKLSLLDKENAWLLCTEDAIVWVVGRRADNRFRVTDHTKHILKIELR